MSGIRHIKRDERGGEKSPEKPSCANCGHAILPAEVVAAVRDLVKSEFKRLRRDELFYMRAGMRAELKGIEEELNLQGS